MQDKIDADIKAAMLAADKVKVETLRGVKNAIQNEVIKSGQKDRSLSDEQIQKILAREVKKRTEAAEIYKKGGSDDRAQAELVERAIIESYLPEQAGDEEIAKVVDEEFTKIDNPSMASMGRIIAAVRARLGAGADGGTVASLVKQRLEQK